jgi:hypothetical protein
MMSEVTRYESLEEALMFAIRRSHKEIKEVAVTLWPSDPHQTAYGRLVDALNPAKRQKLSMNEIIFIMHYCQQYDPLYYMADQCLHDRPVAKCIATEEKEIKEHFDNLMKQSMKAYQHIVKMTKKREEIEKIRNGHVTFHDFEKKLG